jgi:hypothetical protein
VPAKEQIAVLYGLFSVTFVRGEYAAARPVAEQALAVAAAEFDPEAIAFANRMMGIVDWATGDFLAAAPRLRRVLPVKAYEIGSVETEIAYFRAFTHVSTPIRSKDPTFSTTNNTHLLGFPFLLTMVKRLPFRRRPRRTRRAPIGY